MERLQQTTYNSNFYRQKMFHFCSLLRTAFTPSPIYSSKFLTCLRPRDLDVPWHVHVAVVDGEPPAPDGQPPHVADLHAVRQLEEHVLVLHALQGGRLPATVLGLVRALLRLPADAAAAGDLFAAIDLLEPLRVLALLLLYRVHDLEEVYVVWVLRVRHYSSLRRGLRAVSHPKVGSCKDTIWNVIGYEEQSHYDFVPLPGPVFSYLKFRMNKCLLSTT